MRQQGGRDDRGWSHLNEMLEEKKFVLTQRYRAPVPNLRIGTYLRRPNKNLRGHKWRIDDVINVSSQSSQFGLETEKSSVTN